MDLSGQVADFIMSRPAFCRLQCEKVVGARGEPGNEASNGFGSLIPRPFIGETFFLINGLGTKLYRDLVDVWRHTNWT